MIPISRIAVVSLPLLAALSVLTPTISLAGPPADVRQGQKLFARCAGCHSADTTMGPGLNGIVGRTAGTQAGYRYSTAMRRAGLVWDQATLQAFVRSPQSVVKGNKMAFGGLASDRDAADVVAYLAARK